MFLDARHIADGDVLDVDLCVIGAGAAGVALALEFAHTETRVLLLEGGGATDDGDNPGIYRIVPGSTFGLVVDPAQTWYLGGNTNHWFGNCRPLDDVDFEPRPWIPYSGWPLRRYQLLPFYERAQLLCGLGPFALYDFDTCRAGLTHQPLDVDPAKLAHKVVQTCPVLSFGELYRQRLEVNPNVRVCFHARALRLATNARADAVHSVDVASVDGGRFRVSARVFVLAGGGIENPRLLLCSDDVKPNGLGNDHDLVGRFFMEHPYVDIPLGDWRPRRDVVFHHGRQQVSRATVSPMAEIRNVLLDPGQLLKQVGRRLRRRPPRRLPPKVTP